MPKITSKIIKVLYNVSKQVYFEETSLSKAIKFLEDSYGMNKNSMAYYIYAFKHLMDGKEYTRTISYEGTKYYLENILNDYGIERHNNAITALKLHITYYEKLQNITMKKQRKLLKEVENIRIMNVVYPDEITRNESKDIVEGTKKRVIVNIYERDSKARLECLKEFGYICRICEFDFEKKYGDIGKEFIHVHHLLPLSEIKKEYKVNPIKDLIPVCPNCHAMLHKRIPAYTPEDIKNFMKTVGN